jgi:hypothetical protein
MSQVGLHDDMDNPLHAGRRPILRWTVRMRLDTSGESNPAVNRKAVCKVCSGACADRSSSSMSSW